MAKHPTLTVHNEGQPEKTIELSGKAKVTQTGDRLEVTPKEGAVALIIQQGNGSMVYVWHPLSGWYVQSVAPDPGEEGAE